MSGGRPRTRLAVALIGSFAAVAPRATTQVHDCSLALALGLDVSASVDGHEYTLQLQGVARALQSSEVRAVLLLQPAPVHVMAFEWSDRRSQALIVDWVAVDSPDALDALAARIAGHQRRVPAGSTAIGSAITYAAEAFARGPPCQQRTLDLSADGSSNDGAEPDAPQVRAASAGQRINALVIGVDDFASDQDQLVGIGELVAYFRSRVVRGPDAFVETALGFEAFEQAMIRKLLRELPAPRIGHAPRMATDPSRP